MEQTVTIACLCPSGSQALQVLGVGIYYIFEYNVPLALSLEFRAFLVRLRAPRHCIQMVRCVLEKVESMCSILGGGGVSLRPLKPLDKDLLLLWGTGKLLNAKTLGN